MLAGGDPAKVNFLFPVQERTSSSTRVECLGHCGSHTASGKPLLSQTIRTWNFRLPGIWYMTHLQAPGLEVGVSLPGVPGVIVGHNDRIAWGVTNLGYDVQDLYLEKHRLAYRPLSIPWSAGAGAAERELDRVQGPAPVSSAMGDAPRPRHRRERVSYWLCAGPPRSRDSFQFPFLDIDRAHNWQEFTAALARFPGPGAEFRLCGRGRQHRLSRHRQAADPSQL